MRADGAPETDLPQLVLNRRFTHGHSHWLTFLSEQRSKPQSAMIARCAGRRRHHERIRGAAKTGLVARARPKRLNSLFSAQPPASTIYGSAGLSWNGLRVLPSAQRCHSLTAMHSIHRDRRLKAADEAARPQRD